MAERDYFVVPHRGRWAVKAAGSSKEPAVFDTKREAIDAAYEIAGQKNGHVIVHGRNGQPFLESEAPSKLEDKVIRAALRDGTLDRARACEPERKAKKRGAKSLRG